MRLVSAGGELVLLHGNEFRLRMLVNLVAELNSHGLYNALLLGFTSAPATARAGASVRQGELRYRGGWVSG